MLALLVDGDACPVKDEVYVVATRYRVPVALVANSRMYVPEGFGVEMVVVDGSPDAADDWIAENARPGDVVITADIPLASRCLAAGARVLGTNGRPFTEDSIGGAVAVEVQWEGRRVNTARDLRRPQSPDGAIRRERLDRTLVKGDQ